MLNKEEYELRWSNAKRIARVIMKHLDNKDIIYDEENGIVISCQITDKEIYIESSDGLVLFFENNEEYDHGLYTEISEYNKKFIGWKVVPSESITKLEI